MLSGPPRAVRRHSMAIRERPQRCEEAKYRNHQPHPRRHPNVTQDVEPTVVKSGMSHAPVLITEQEVVFSTAAATSPRPASISRKLIDAIRGVGAALHRPPRPHYPQRSSYLELSRTAREMDRS